MGHPRYWNLVGIFNILLPLGGAPVVPAEYAVAASDSLGAYSYDLETWLLGNTSGVARGHWGVVHNPSIDRWLIVGNGGSGDTQYSDDGAVNWTSQTSNTGQNMERAAYMGGYFFMGSNNGSVFRSATGLASSWSAQANGARSYSLCYSEEEDRLVSVGNTNASTDVPFIYYTDDAGANWSAGSVTGLETGGGGAGPNLVGLTYDKYRLLWWVLNANGKVYTTPDIVSGTWTLKYTVDPCSARGAIACSGPGASPVVVTTASNGIWTSVDGGSSFTEYETTVAIRDVKWSDYFEKFIGVSSDKIWTSPDGQTWTAKFTDGTQSFGAVGLALGAPVLTYATWDPATHNADITLSNGDLTATRGATNNSAWRSVRSTIGRSTGKWQYELTITGASPASNNGYILGMADSGISQTNYVGSAGQQYGFQTTAGPTGFTYTNGGSATFTLAFYAIGDVLTITWDANTGTIDIYKNGVLAQTGSVTANTLLYPAVSFYTSTNEVVANFGATALAFPVSGFNNGFYN